MNYIHCTDQWGGKHAVPAISQETHQDVRRKPITCAGGVDDRHPARLKMRPDTGPTRAKGRASRSVGLDNNSFGFPSDVSSTTGELLVTILQHVIIFRDAVTQIGVINQGCSTLLEVFDIFEGFDAAESCGVSILGDGVGLIEAKDIVGEAA
jgi:hypothetical protein